MSKVAKLSIVILSALSLFGCKKQTERSSFGVFLGASNSAITKLLNYDNVAIEIDEFNESSINKLKDNNTAIYAYLSIGSLESYRSYYEQYKDITFMDYENWPNERWIDTSNASWQNLMSELATSFKNKGADGLFLDNFDVYYIANEEYECLDEFKEDIYNGCKTILDNASKLDLKLLINSGTDFLERLNDENDPLLDKVNVFAQECVFSTIEDYENNVFSRQDKETQDYYFSIIEFMKKKAKILLIEYTVDEELKKTIIDYSNRNSFYYYISSAVNLE